jgi:uroporphyrinogen decarboxylase
MLFDTWGGALSHAAFHEFSLPYLRAVLERLPRSHDGQIVPRTVFTKGGGLWLESLANAGPDCVGVDGTRALGAARASNGGKVALQGILTAACFVLPPMLWAKRRGKSPPHTAPGAVTWSTSVTAFRS